MRDCLKLLNEPNSSICVGLDPDLSKIPNEYKNLPPFEAVSRFLTEIIEITSKYASAYKLQKAFFDLYDGTKLLKDAISTIHKSAPDAPAIVDCKIGDIENTMHAYLRNIFQNCNADGIVINPYMGQEVFHAFSNYSDRGIAVLVRTSNPGANIIQDIPVKSETKKREEPLWSYILDRVVSDWNKNRNMIPVLSEHASLERIRERIPSDMPILYAGVGAQGGDLTKIRCLFNQKDSGVIVNSSRAILYPYNSTDKDWRDKVEQSIRGLHYSISKVKRK